MKYGYLLENKGKSPLSAPCYNDKCFPKIVGEKATDLLLHTYMSFSLLSMHACMVFNWKSIFIELK